MNAIIPTTLIKIGWPQVSGGCPYKVLNSQWVPTRPKTNEQMNKWMCQHYISIIKINMLKNSFDQGT